MSSQRKLDRIVRSYREKEGNIVVLLQETQEAFGYIPRAAVEYFAEELGIAPSRFYGVATFYAQFRHRPTGRNLIVACCGTACHVRGAERIAGSLRRQLALPEGEDTTDDGEFTLERVACLGTCSAAPVVLVNGEVHAKARADALGREVRALRGKK